MTKSLIRCMFTGEATVVGCALAFGCGLVFAARGIGWRVTVQNMLALHLTLWLALASFFEALLSLAWSACFFAVHATDS